MLDIILVMTVGRTLVSVAGCLGYDVLDIKIIVLIHTVEFQLLVV